MQATHDRLAPYDNVQLGQRPDPKAKGHGTSLIKWAGSTCKAKQSRHTACGSCQATRLSSNWKGYPASSRWSLRLGKLAKRSTNSICPRWLSKENGKRKQPVCGKSCECLLNILLWDGHTAHIRLHHPKRKMCLGRRDGQRQLKQGLGVGLTQHQDHHKCKSDSTKEEKIKKTESHLLTQKSRSPKNRYS